MVDVEAFLRQLSLKERHERAKAEAKALLQPQPQSQESSRQPLASLDAQHNRGVTKRPADLTAKPHGPTLAHLDYVPPLVSGGVQRSTRASKPTRAIVEGAGAEVPRAPSKLGARAGKASLPLHPKQAQALRVRKPLIGASSTRYGGKASAPGIAAVGSSGNLSGLAPVLPAGRRRVQSKSDAHPRQPPELPRKTHRGSGAVGATGAAGAVTASSSHAQENAPPVPRMHRSRSIDGSAPEAFGEARASQRRFRRSRSVSEMVLPEELTKTPKAAPAGPAFALRAPTLSPESDDAGPAQSSKAAAVVAARVPAPSKEKRMKRGEAAKLLAPWELDSRSAAKSILASTNALRNAISAWEKGGRHRLELDPKHPEVARVQRPAASKRECCLCDGVGGKELD